MGLKFVGRDFRVAAAGLSRDAVARRMAEVSRRAVREALAAGEGTESRVTFVNGRRGVPEELVVPPGPIVVRFNWWEEIAEYALAFARARSPSDSGAYRESWFILVDGAETAPAAIPAGTETVVLVNDRPYHRKIDVGAMEGLRVPPHIVEATRQALRARYGTLIRPEVAFIELAGGYVLKGRRPGKPAKADRRSRAHRAGRAYLSARRDTRRGQPMTYPAVEISLR